MALGDITFVTAFVVFPIVIIILSIWGLRTLGRREHRPLARFGSDNPAESTQEMPMAQPAPPRDWAATIQPTRGHKSEVAEPSISERTKPFTVPRYRGRSGGVVRRVAFGAGLDLRRGKQHPPANDDSETPE